MKGKKILNQLNRFLVPAVFLLILAGGGLWQFAMPDRDYSASERRVLAQKPEFSVENVLDASYMAEFESYLTDQFPMRDNWITVKAYTGLLLGQRETGGVYIAEDDSLIELHRESDFVEGQLAQNTEFLMQFATDMAGSYGAEHVRIMLVPTADHIWADKLPDNIRLLNQAGYADEIRQSLEAAGSGYAQMLVDVETELVAHADEEIYYKTDHHWTALGAYYGYVAYAESLAGTGVSVRSLSDYELVTVTEDFTGTTAAKCGMYHLQDTIELIYPAVEEMYYVNHNDGMMISDSLYEKELAHGDDPYAVYLGGNDAIVTIETSAAEMTDYVNHNIADSGNGYVNQNERSLLIVRDSYANCFVPYLTSDYVKITLVDLRYYNGSIRALMEEGYTDVLLQYNLPNFVGDRQVYKLIK